MKYEGRFRGLVQIYTGDGKGKTTAAAGLAARAAESGLRTEIVQFMKKGGSGEMEFLKRSGMVSVRSYGTDGFSVPGSPDPQSVSAAGEALEAARSIMSGMEEGLLVLDEINCAVSFGLIKEDDVLSLIDSRPSGVELVLTGRGATEKVINKADLVTEMREIRHPWKSGTPARKGIEY